MQHCLILHLFHTCDVAYFWLFCFVSLDMSYRQGYILLKTSRLTFMWCIHVNIFSKHFVKFTMLIFYPCHRACSSAGVMGCIPVQWNFWWWPAMGVESFGACGGLWYVTSLVWNGTSSSTSSSLYLKLRNCLRFVCFG